MNHKNVLYIFQNAFHVHFQRKKNFFYRYISFFVLPKTEGSAETGSLTFPGAIIDVKSINIITDIYRIMFISNSIPVVAVWKIKIKTHANMCLIDLFREINSTKIFVTMISRQISSEVLIYHLYFGLVNFLLLHYLGHRNWNLVQRHPNQDHLTMMSWSDHFLSAGMWTYLIEDN